MLRYGRSLKTKSASDAQLSTDRILDWTFGIRRWTLDICEAKRTFSRFEPTAKASHDLGW
jgi:hypothetical protein